MPSRSRSSSSSQGSSTLLDSGSTFALEDFTSNSFSQSTMSQPGGNESSRSFLDGSDDDLYDEARSSDSDEEPWWSLDTTSSDQGGDSGGDDDPDLSGVTWTRKGATKALFEEHETLRTKVGKTRRKLEVARDKEHKGEIRKLKKAERRQMKKAMKGVELEPMQEDVITAAKWPLDPFALNLDKRLKNGPILNDAELDVVKVAGMTTGGARWLSAAGLFTETQALGYLQGGKFYDWLLLEPATRIELATFAWNLGLGKHPVTPPYSLGRHFVLNTSEDDTDRIWAENERDLDVQSMFVNTMLYDEMTPEGAYAIEHGAILAPTEGKSGAVGKAVKGALPGIKNLPKDKITDPETVRDNNGQAIGILERIFLVLQAGLQVYDEQLGEHVDLEGTDVCRALAHGGRVNIRIPALQGDETGHELTDWLGITEDGHGAGGAVFARGFGTHHMKIDDNLPGVRGDFIEEGEGGAALRNLTDGTRMWGVNLSAGGLGKLDHNGDVILPDGAHGHMFVGFTAPTRERDGALQVGMETTGPGAPSMVGYVHDSSSTEATANPESSFGGHKSDKIGDGSPRKVKRKGLTTKGKDYDGWESTNARYVDLAGVNGGDWLAYLEALRTDWLEPMKEQDRGQALRTLTGPRTNLE